MHKNISAKSAFFLVFALIPLFLWTSGEGKQIQFIDFYTGLITLGKAAGIAGISLFSGNLILSGRYRLLDRLFHGLDQLFLFHRKTGIYTFLLLCFHVLTISLLPLQVSLAALFQSLLDFSNLAINFGRTAFLGLFAIVLFTLFRSGKIKYEIVKKTHQFLGVFLFIGGLHAFFIPSDISRNMYLRAYVFTLVVLALASYLWRTVLKKWLLKKISCEVIQVRLLNQSTTEVTFKPKDERIVRFYPGQFIFIRFLQKDFPAEEHPFSLTSSTEEKVLRISAKQIGDFTKKLPELKPGAQAFVHGPFGGFTFLWSPSLNQIWIAGGIGVTPFLSMARTVHERIQDNALQKYHIDMIYSVASSEEFICVDELERISRELPNFKFTPWVTKDRGYLAVKAIQEITDIKNKEIFICGPKPMMQSLKDQFIRAGVLASRIRYEFFRLL